MSDWCVIAKELGFLHPSSCSIEELEPVVQHLENRKKELDPFISRNFESFRFPQKTFPRARYLISLALPYYQKPSYNSMGKFSSFSIYCQGKDYHTIFKSLLSEYLNRLKDRYPSNYFAGYSDTGPILDRAVAAASGMGYLGYNTSIIHKKAGSFIFLATVLTDLDLNNGAFLGPCKECGSCLKACPTGAIKKPYLVDSNLCISAITQKRGFLSYEECKMIKGHVFGCDICQTVCPHNKNLSPSPMITPFAELKNPLFIDLILPTKDTAAKIKKSAAGWRGLNTVRRNALIALAFSSEKFDPELLKEVARKDPSHLVRAYSAFALQKRIGDKSLWPDVIEKSDLPQLKEFYQSVEDSG